MIARRGIPGPFPEDLYGDTRPMKHNDNFFRFLLYVKPYTLYIVLAVLGGITKFTVPLLVPEMTRYLLDEVYLNPAMSAAEKLSRLFLVTGGMAAVFLFFWSPMTYIRHYYAGKAGHASVFDLRCDLYYRILRMSASFFDRNKSGAIVSRLISDIELAQNLVGNALTNIWMDAVSLVVILFFLIRIDLKLTLVALVTFPLYLYFFRRLRRKIQDSSYQVQTELAELSGNLQEKIAGNRVVHAFAQETREEKVFKSDSDRLLLTAMRRVYYQSLNMTVTGTLVQIAPLIVTVYGGWMVITGGLSVGEIVAAGMYLGSLYMPLQRFSELNVVFANSMAALQRIQNAPDAVKLPEMTGRVEFRNVSFAYAADNPVLHGVSFTAEQGERIALVGASGSGKSTIVSLIPRFYDVEDGAVLVDGVDVRKAELKSLRSNIGMVLQDPVLFSGSIRDNIMYGNPTASDRELLDACRAANAAEFISRLPDGFSTDVGEGGVFLSGGQKQRLTIARAFLKNPRILILDEATSALDPESEHLIQDALDRLMVGRTTFIIAHRLATITKADRIFVLEHGRIAENGTHMELLRKNGVYAEFYRKQFRSAKTSLEIL
jgi:ABC-type multidrug transport system fused ATPase/permease subunit